MPDTATRRLTAVLVASLAAMSPIKANAGSGNAPLARDEEVGKNRECQDVSGGWDA